MTEDRGQRTDGRRQRTDGRRQMTEALEFGIGNAECGIE
jgi:hypothetical protein